MDRSYYKPYKYLAARKEHDDMPNRINNTKLTNMEVNRLYNIKKNNVDRYTNLKEGKVTHYFPEPVAKQLNKNKNSSQIVFGSEAGSPNYYHRKTTLLAQSKGYNGQPVSQSQRNARYNASYDNR